MKSIHILLVEDNPADGELLQESLTEQNCHADVTLVEDGIDALAYLRKEAPFESATRPDLVICDLNLPQMDGHETLGAIKADPSLADIPVVIMTSSAAATDVAASYSRQAAAFIRKPLDLEGYERIAGAIDGFWIALVRYPETG